MMNSLSRRSFLQGSAVALGALSSMRAYAANESIRVAIIGCRNRGHQVGLPMAQSGLFQIGTLCDCDTAMFAIAEKELSGHLSGHKMEQDFRRVLEDKDIDAVVVAVPDHWHAAITALALEAGKHVYCEKPASFDLGDSALMRAAHAKYPQHTAVVGTQQRSGPHFQEAKGFIEGGGLGTVGFVRTWITHEREKVRVVKDSDPPETLNYDLWVGPAPFRPHNREKCHYNWHFVKDLGTGEMGNWGAHWLDIASWNLNLPLPTAVSGHGGQFVVKDAKETPDTQTVIYEYPGVTLLWEQRLWTKRGMNGDGSGVEFVGDKGSMILTRGGWTVTPVEGKAERKPGSELMMPHVTNFAESIRGTAKPIASLEDGLHTAALCHLGNLSVETGKKIRLDESGAVSTLDGQPVTARRDYRGEWRAVQERYGV
jgi:predicted dehydrogenase